MVWPAITVDPKGIGLTNVTVTDKLPAEWSLESSMWDWVGSSQPGIHLTSITYYDGAG